MAYVGKGCSITSTQAVSWSDIVPLGALWLVVFFNFQRRHSSGIDTL
jgi:hypothetical protein